MKAAQRMAAQLLAAEPGIRDFVRREFMASAIVTTGAIALPQPAMDITRLCIADVCPACMECDKDKSSPMSCLSGPAGLKKCDSLFILRDNISAWSEQSSSACHATGKYSRDFVHLRRAAAVSGRHRRVPRVRLRPPHPQQAGQQDARRPVCAHIGSGARGLCHSQARDVGGSLDVLAIPSPLPT